MGKWGYCEVLVPTVLNAQGYKISDLGNTYYDRKRFRAATFMPVGPIFLLPKDKLYHPIGRNYLAELSKRLVPGSIKKWVKKVLGRK